MSEDDDVDFKINDTPPTDNILTTNPLVLTPGDLPLSKIPPPPSTRPPPITPSKTAKSPSKTPKSWRSQIGDFTRKISRAVFGDKLSPKSMHKLLVQVFILDAERRKDNPKPDQLAINLSMHKLMETFQKVYNKVDVNRLAETIDFSYDAVFATSSLLRTFKITDKNIIWANFLLRFFFSEDVQTESIDNFYIFFKNFEYKTLTSYTNIEDIYKMRDKIVELGKGPRRLYYIYKLKMQKRVFDAIYNRNQPEIYEDGGEDEDLQASQKLIRLMNRVNEIIKDLNSQKYNFFSKKTNGGGRGCRSVKRARRRKTKRK